MILAPNGAVLIDQIRHSPYLISMAKRPILHYPDPILRERALPMERIDSELHTLLDDMLETMYDAPGVGLAGPQIGVSRRILVLDASPTEERMPQCIINPEILESSDKTSVYEEGCLSMPEIFAEVERPASVLVRYLNRNGVQLEELFEGKAATIIQHEIDHLNGVMFIDHLSRLRRDLLVRKFRKTKRDEIIT